MKQTMAQETVFKSMLIFILGSLAKLGFPGLLLMTVKQSMGVSGAMKETSSVLSKVSAASGVGGRAAAVATSSLGGGHYVESLRTMASGLKGSGLGVLGRTIPTLESIGSKSLSGLTRGISAIAPNPLKDKVRKVGETKNLALSNIKRTSGKVQSYFQGSNPEAFSLGSPIGKKSLGGTASAKGGGGRNSFDQGQRSSNFAAKPSFYNSSAGATPRTPGSNGGYASLKRSNQRRGNDGGITERQKYV